MAGMQESWEKDGWGIICEVGEYAWIDTTNKDHNRNNREARGIGSIVNEYVCNNKL